MTDRICPRCFLPAMDDDDVMNSLSFDGETYICTDCGKIESYDKIVPHLAEGIRIGQRRAQAALYGLDEDNNPKLPKITKKGEKWYETHSEA